MTINALRCPRCGALITTRGASHSGSGSQWECRCGYIEQDTGQGWHDSPTPRVPRGRTIVPPSEGGAS